MSYSQIIKDLEDTYMNNTAVPAFAPGDTVCVHVKVKEGDKSRVQKFEGVVIAKDGSGLSESFTVTRTTSGYTVERVFLVQSPLVEKIEVMRQGRVRRAKLYYLRERSGKSAKIREKARVKKEVAAPVAAE